MVAYGSGDVGTLSLAHTEVNAMRPFRRNSYLKGPEATEILRQLSDPRLKDSLDEPHESVDSI